MRCEDSRHPLQIYFFKRFIIEPVVLWITAQQLSIKSIGLRSWVDGMNETPRAFRARKKWIKCYKKLGSVSKAAVRCGIPITTLYRWLKRYEEFPNIKNYCKERYQNIEEFFNSIGTTETKCYAYALIVYAGI